ncbi:MAG TPA: MMPL family transporter [Spirochaetota bacterium]|nr:MMPL family transporter [Spirochaetota bacterium]HPI88557.1 MMPL family transporter [Spirochaetota bacterium]HPR48198.1 MMPL family transporter [Spirochaetota bacterium]
MIRHWIRFTVEHPKIVMTLLLLATVFSLAGLPGLRFDPSTEAMMPHDDQAATVGEREDVLFGDSGSFFVTAIEPAPGFGLFSQAVFIHLNALVSEIEEFREFDKEVEDRRLNRLCKLGAISYPETKEPASDDSMPRPRMTRREYNYRLYRPVTVVRIKEALDSGGVRQLESVMKYLKIGSLKENHELSVDEFKRILETWETLYRYKSLRIVKVFMNPLSGQDIQRKKKELVSVDLVPVQKGARPLPEDSDDFEAYKKRLLANPSFEWTIYSRDNAGLITSLGMSVLLRHSDDYREIFAYLSQVIEKYNTDPVMLSMSGIPVVRKYISDRMRVDLERLLPLAMIVIIIFLCLNFGAMSGLLLPVLSMVMGSVWTLGIMGHLKIPVTLITCMLLPLLVVAGVFYSMHLFSQFLRDRAAIRGAHRKFFLISSLGSVSSTVFAAALITSGGLMAMPINHTGSLIEFGIFASLGTLLCMAASVMLVPSALILMRASYAGEKKEARMKSLLSTAVERMMSFFVRIALEKNRAVVAGALVLCIIFIFGIRKIVVDTGLLSGFRAHSADYESYLRVSDLFRGSEMLNLVIDSGKKDGVKDPKFLISVEKLRMWLTEPGNRERYHLVHTAAFGDVVRQMNMAMNEGGKENYAVPDEESTIAEYLEQYSGTDSDSDGMPDSLEQFIDRDYRYMNVLVRIGSAGGGPVSSSIIREGQERVLAYLGSKPETAHYACFFSGDAINRAALADLILEGTQISMLLALIIAGVSIVVLFRNVMTGLIALISIGFSAGAVYGIMGYAGIPLTITMALLSPVAVVAGVDNAFHILKKFRMNLSQGLSRESALKETHHETGSAIVYAAFVLVPVFSVLMFSQFRPFFYFGLLCVMFIIVNVLCMLILLPSTILLSDIHPEKEMKGRFFSFFPGIDDRVGSTEDGVHDNAGSHDK